MFMSPLFSNPEVECYRLGDNRLELCQKMVPVVLGTADEVWKQCREGNACIFFPYL